MAIRGVLEEELQNSLRMQESYEAELARLPVGSLVRRRIKGHFYYYLVYRENGKVRSVYQGRPSEEELQRYRQAREYRAKYRGLLAQVRKEIRFLRRALRGKQAV